MRTVAIIQARMGSSRFPGKMLAPLGDAPLIEWVLARSDAAKTVDAVVLATSELQRDDCLAEHAERLGLACFRGSEQDVLGRYAAAARAHDAEVVVRICGDRPLVDPHCVDLAVACFEEGSADLAFNHISDGVDRWPRGFGAEVLSAETLHWLDRTVTDPGHREHVTLYLWDHRRDHRLRAAPCPPEMDPGEADVLFDVDHAEDLEKLRRLCDGEPMDVAAARIVQKWLHRERQPSSAS